MALARGLQRYRGLVRCARVFFGTGVRRFSTSTPIQHLLSQYRSGFSLPREFYTSDDVFRLEMEQLWPHSWLFAGFENQVRKSGDYFVYNIGQHSIIIVRDQTQAIRAFHNVCRHRGSRLLLESHGRCNQIVCKYHRWAYDLEGQLMHARQMQDNGGFRADQHHLHPVQVTSVGGLIFVRPLGPRAGHDTEDEATMGAAQRLFEKQLAVHDLRRTKIAHSICYTVQAKALCVYENNRECEHCIASHPEYIRSNYDTQFIYSKSADSSETTTRILDPDHSRRHEAADAMAEDTARWRRLGLPFECTPDNSFVGGWFRASRQPLRRGWVTESLDGQLVCKRLLGQGVDPNLGSLRLHTLPNFWLHCSSDHAVSTRLTPLDKTTTECKVDWLVHEDAVANQDYHLDRLLPFWQKTSEQDWSLCEAHQLGVLSAAYQSGPLSVRKESGLVHFLDWYVKALRRCTF